ncbi:MAG: hypothetical protein RLZZ175_2231 [Bacteroidota bacterium]|jgi:hypothetical protein
MNQLVKLMKLEVGNLWAIRKQGRIIFFSLSSLSTNRNCISWELAPS